MGRATHEQAGRQAKYRADPPGAIRFRWNGAPGYSRDERSRSGSRRIALAAKVYRAISAPTAPPALGGSWRSSPIASARGVWATRNGLGCWNPSRRTCRSGRVRRHRHRAGAVEFGVILLGREEDDLAAAGVEPEGDPEQVPQSLPHLLPAARGHKEERKDAAARAQQVPAARSAVG